MVHCCLWWSQVPVGEAAVHKQLELRYMGIIITKLLLEHNEKWFSEREQQLLVSPTGAAGTPLHPTSTVYRQCMCNCHSSNTVKMVLLPLSSLLLQVEHLKKIWMSQDYHENGAAKNLLVSTITLS